MTTDKMDTEPLYNLHFAKAKIQWISPKILNKYYYRIFDTTLKLQLFFTIYDIKGLYYLLTIRPWRDHGSDRKRVAHAL